MKDKHAGGRPTLYKTEYNDQAYKLCLLGATDKDLASIFNTTEQAIEQWIIEIPEFRNSILKAMRDYPEYIRYKEEQKAKRREYKKQPHIRKYNNEYMKNKVKTDIHYKIRFNVSTVMRSRLKSKNKQGVFRNLGYTVQELINHLERQFVEGMTWGNYGKVWHIDHVKPDSWFIYENMDDEGFKQAWDINNLQPLFKEDNLRKGNRYAG
jgi:hypothetical protein